MWQPSSSPVTLLVLSLPLLLLLLPSSALSVSVPYTLCSSSTAHFTVSNVTANVWPPVIGSNFTVNIIGSIDKAETSGEWTISAKLGGIPLPKVSGDVGDFHPLPWAKGNLTLSRTETVPALTLPGSYAVQVSAVDGDKEQILCATLTFKLKAAVSQWGEEAVEVVRGGSVMERWRRMREQARAKATIPM